MEDFRDKRESCYLIRDKALLHSVCSSLNSIRAIKQENKFEAILPKLDKELEQFVFVDFLLVLNVFYNVECPFHEISYLVTGRGAIHAVLELLLDLFP